MKFAKSILLASATAFVSFAATAADLPKKSAPAPVCGFGAGFFMVPGTTTCLQIGGLVRVEAFFGAGSGGAYQAASYYGSNNYAFGSRFFLHADARTQTSMGVVRSYGRWLATNGTSNYGGASTGVRGNAIALDAFIQFAGITAGHTLTNFGLYKNNYGYQMLTGANDTRSNQFAYTASLGQGLTATIALEDGRDASMAYAAQVNPAVPALGSAITLGAAGRPDVVANVNYAQAWGQVQVNAAFVENRGLNGWSKSGAAFGAGALFNVSSATQLMLQGAVSNGANTYLGRVARTGVIGNDPVATAFAGTGANAYNDVAGLANSAGYSVTGGVNHNWNSSFRTALVGSFANIDAPGANALANIYDTKTTSVALTNNYTVTPGLTVGLELLWEQTKVSQNGSILAPGAAGAGIAEKYTNTGLNFRIQRLF